jgi:hypothetical protein
MDHSADDARHIREARARKAERRRAIVDARIADSIWRARFLTLDCEIAAIRAASEAGLRADWRPAPPERARVCRLPACRRHGACQGDALRRVCGIPPTPTPEPLTWPEPRVPPKPGRNEPDSTDTGPSFPSLPAPGPAARENRPSLDDLLSQLSPDILRTLTRQQGEDTEDPQPVAKDEPDPAEDATDDDDDGLALPRRYDPCDFRNYAGPATGGGRTPRETDPVFAPEPLPFAPPDDASPIGDRSALPRCRFPG